MKVFVDPAVEDFSLSDLSMAYHVRLVLSIDRVHLFSLVFQTSIFHLPGS